jgi:hypothetical protein
MSARKEKGFTTAYDDGFDVFMNNGYLRGECRPNAAGHIPFTRRTTVVDTLDINKPGKRSLREAPTAYIYLPDYFRPAYTHPDPLSVPSHPSMIFLIYSLPFAS